MAVIVWVSVISAQTEFVINSRTNSVQRDPQIARMPSGEYMVVWSSTDQAAIGSKGDICFRVFDAQDQPLTPESLMNTEYAGNQEKPALACNSAGLFVAAWQSYCHLDSAYDIKARIYNRSFSVPTTEFLVNSTVAKSQSNPDVAVADDGKFVVVWESWDQDGRDRGVYAQIYKNTGEKQGSEFRINTTTLYSQSRPVVKYFSNGNFIVAWESWRQDNPSQAGYGVYAQIFSSDGVRIGNEFPVNTYVVDYQWFADIETFDDNSFIIVWCSWEEDGDDGGIYAQRFNADASKLGNEIQINRSTPQYQWLPRIVKTNANHFAVVWSSWKQDGSREGVYAAFFDSEGKRLSFETRVNDYTENYQWEPDVAAIDSNQLLVVWSSWNQFGRDYDVIAKHLFLSQAQGYLDPEFYQHTGGVTTSRFTVHVIDSTQLTGDQYQISFDSTGRDSLSMRIRNLTTGTVPVECYPVPDVENMVNLTPAFDGICVEISPEVDLALDSINSYAVLHSGTTVSFRVGVPSFGKKLLAPVDIALIWGQPDTLSTGEYAFPLDTALNRSNGKEEILCPFRAWDMVNHQPVGLLVSEVAGMINKRWDPAEPIVVQTPPPYQISYTNTLAQISSWLSDSEPVVMPAPGDTVFVLTTRPLTPADTFVFQTDRNLLVGYTQPHHLYQHRLVLDQNYPNPFNPVTTIAFEMPAACRVRIDLFDILGRNVETLLDDHRESGRHRIVLDAAGIGLSSGIYFYQIRAAGITLTRKMMLLK